MPTVPLAVTLSPKCAAHRAIVWRSSSIRARWRGVRRGTRIDQRALALADLDDGGEPVFFPVARRFLQAREALGLSKAKWPENGARALHAAGDLQLYISRPSMSSPSKDWKLWAVLTGLRRAFAVWRRSVIKAAHDELFRGCSEDSGVEIDDRAMPVEQMSELVGWQFGQYTLRTRTSLQSYQFLDCGEYARQLMLDWATTLANPTARLTAG